MHANHWLLASFLIPAAVAAWRDARTGHIPNVVSIGALLAAPLLWFVVVAVPRGMAAGLDAAGHSLLGALVCGVGPALFFWRGGIGGGDVKLMIALGAWLGPSLGLDAEFYAFVVAASWIPVRLAWDGKLLRWLAASGAQLLNPLRAKGERRVFPSDLSGSIRLGPAILAGTLLAFGLRSLP